MIGRWIFSLIVSVVFACGFTMDRSCVSAFTVDVPVGFDRWMYPFNFTPGMRTTGSVFGAIGSPDFDDRDAQILVGFDVTNVQAPQHHVLSSVTLRLTTAADRTFTYDPTPDPLASYAGGADPDAGRPLELFGVGTRNGFVALTTNLTSANPLLFKETSPFSSMPGVFTGVRSAFAASFENGSAMDVSNNVRGMVDAEPWAVGTIAGVTPGDLVPINFAVEFAVNLADAKVADYVEQGMNRGEIFFAITGLHSASQGGPAVFPVFYLDAGGTQLGPVPQLTLTFTPVPEPCVQVCFVLGLFWGGGQRIRLRTVIAGDIHGGC